MALFEAIINIAARTAHIEEGVKRVEEKFTELGEFAKKTGELIGIAFSADYLKEMIVGSIELADQMGKAAQKAGASVDQFSALAYAAKQADVSMESLSTGIKFMQKNIDANNPSLERIGIALSDLKGKSPIDQLSLLANKIAGIQDPTEKTAIVLKLLGHAGTDLIPLLNQGADGIKHFTDEADKLGISFNEEQLSHIEAADEAIKRLGSQFDALKRNIALGIEKFAEFLNLVEKPELNKLNDELANLVERRGDLLKTIDNMNHGWLSRFLLGDDFNSAKAGVEKQLAGVEKLMNETNDRLLKLGNQDKSITNVGSATDPELLNKFDSVKDHLVQMIATYGKVGEAAKLSFDLQSGSLSNLSETQKKALIDLGNQYDALVAKANAVKFKDTLDNAYLQDLHDNIAKAQEITKTGFQKSADEADQFYKELKFLRDNDVIDAQDAAQRSAEFMSNFLEPVVVTSKRNAKAVKEATDQMSEYAKSAAQGIQGAMANFLFDPFQNGLKGMLKGFLDVLHRMIAEAEAAKLAEYLFGGKDSSGNQTSGVLSGLLNAGISAIFGGGKAIGGPVNGGSAYLVGEKGPELFMPGSSGTIVPNGAMGGTVNFAPTYNINGSGLNQNQLIQAMNATHARSVDTILDMKRRGRL